MSERKQKGFCLFFDWIDDLDHLDGADAWAVVKALCGYFREGTNPVDAVDGSLRVVVSIMFHQIKRAETISEQRAQNARDTNEKKKAKGEFLRAQSERSASAERTQCAATETDTETETDNSFIRAARTCTREEKENAEREDLSERGTIPERDALGDPLPIEARRELEQLLKEQAKRTYLGGELGQGVVLLSERQLDSLLEELSLDEFNKYVKVVADCELSGKRYRKSHYNAILDMAKADRQVQGGYYG